jgi:four helix bundle protein
VDSGQWIVDSRSKVPVSCTSDIGEKNMADASLRSYKELVVWQRALDLVGEVYAVSKAFPRDEVYGLTAQLRRSAVSVPSNIAEGQGRATRGEFIQFLCHARGSLFELETQIILSLRLNYISADVEERLLMRLTEVARLLNGLLTSLGTAARKTIH